MQRYLAATALVAVIILPPAALADCRSDLNAILDKAMSHGPYAVESTITSGGTKSRFKGKVVPPSSFDIVSDQGRMVLTKNGAWMDMGGGKMQEMPKEMGNMMRNMIQQGMAQGSMNTKNHECLGQQTFQGGTYDTYRYDASGEAMGISSKAKVTMYLDGKGRPAWLVIDGEAMGSKSKIVQKLTFDKSIVIKDPK